MAADRRGDGIATVTPLPSDDDIKQNPCRDTERTDTMRQVVLGRTGQKVSAIGLGTWAFGGPNLDGDTSVGWSQQSDDDSKDALVRSWELDINHWDTADVYGDGRSERVIGQMWKAVPRDRIFLASKVGWDKGDYDHYYHPSLMRRKLEQSLENMKTDVIDLYYFHHCLFGKSGEFFDGALEAMRRFQEEGKIRFIGLSDWDSKKIMTYAPRVQPDVVQPYRNVSDDTYESSGLKSWVESHQAGVVFFSPLKHGLLTGKYTGPVTFGPGDFRSGKGEFQDMAVIEKMRSNRRKLQERFPGHAEPVLHGVVDALLTDAPTGCVLVGQRNRRQAESAGRLGTPLTEEDARWIRSLFAS
ncbi:MAG: aldo/keto reductase [Fidelibacterota bacterium]